jgi:predicted phosphodiesterase
MQWATYAVRGNVDRESWSASLPETRTVEIVPLRFFVLHQIAELRIDPAATGYAAVVYGHSHQPYGVLYVNPGSAGPRRFKLPVTIARVRVSGRNMDPDIVELEVR